MTGTNYNRLASEKSPYLVQHRHNPVFWYPWGEEAFEAAERQDKPIFLSIGYSTCYWCHVMERESFEDQEVADLLNEHFISIKIDREERSDIDKVYMDAVVAMTGHGGWPLSVMLTPDLFPFYGGTYFPREQFMQLLQRIAEVWRGDPDRVRQSAVSIAHALKAGEQGAASELFSGNGKPTAGATPAAEPVGREQFKKFFMQQRHNFDPNYGGFGTAPKFPPSSALALLLRIYAGTGEEHALHMVEKTLEGMARGGIYDHLGGGFARYSTDAKWLVPHFEKMLYDNAQLAKVYLEAAQVTGNEMFIAVARETLDYVLSQMRSDEGGFYAAEDAGEVGREGEFYVWEERELEDVLSREEFAEIKRVYGITSMGNFESNFNILNLQHQFDWSVKNEPLIASAHRKLLDARAQRRRPHRDEKILVSWNALMISALAKGRQVLGDDRYLAAAADCAEFIRQKLYLDGKLLRRHCDGESKFDALLEDYAYLIQALLDLYECDFDSSRLSWAAELQTQLDEGFWDKDHGGYFYSGPRSADVIVRKKDYADGAQPSSNGVAALNLARLYYLGLDENGLTRCRDLAASMRGLIEQYPAAYATTLAAIDFVLSEPRQIVLVGDISAGFLQEAQRTIGRAFFPNKVLAAADPADFDAGSAEAAALPILRGKISPRKPDQKDCIYICRGQTCSEPLGDLESLARALAAVDRYSLA